MTSPRLAKARSSTLLQGSAWILIGLGLQAGLGFSFWLAGSRVASSAQLGRASALYTAIQFINYASGLGLTIALARHATDQSRESDALFGWGIVATFVSSCIGAAAYLALAHTDAAELVSGSFVGWVVFALYTAGLSVGLLVDVRLMAARKWGWLVGRIAVVGLARLPFVLLDVDVRADVWLYHLMLLPAAVGGVALVPLMGRIGAGSISLRRPETLGEVVRYSGVNWGASLASQAPQFVLPLVVAQSVAASSNASFFLAWTMTGLVFLVAGAISQVLLVEGSKDANDPNVGHEPAAGRAREALLFSLGVAIIAWLGSLVVGQLGVALLGDEYRRLARLLPSLMVAGIPWAITSVRLTEARIRKDHLATVAITATFGFGILIPVIWLVPDHGVNAASRAWLFGNVAAALVALVVHRRAHPASPAATELHVERGADRPVV